MGRTLMSDDIADAIVVPEWLLLMQPQQLYAYRVVPGFEARVMRQFRMHRLDGWAPTMPKQQMIKQRSRWNGAERMVPRRVRVPVFPGLVFVPPQVLDVLGLKPSLDGMLDLLQFGPWLAHLDPSGIHTLLDIVAYSNTPRSERSAITFDVGDQVRVVDGPFAMFSARIDRLDCKGRLGVLIEMFGRLTPVEMTADQIEPV